MPYTQLGIKVRGLPNPANFPNGVPVSCNCIILRLRGSGLAHVCAHASGSRLGQAPEFQITKRITDLGRSPLPGPCASRCLESVSQASRSSSESLLKEAAMLL